MNTQTIIRTCTSALLVISCLLIQFPAKAQTKKETIEWLNSKFPKNPIVYGDILKNSRKMKIYPDGSFEVSIIYYESPIDPYNPKVTSTTTYKGHFKDLNPSSITVQTNGRSFFIHIKCFNNKDCINTSNEGEERPYYYRNGVIFGAFDTDENKLAERLKKAFTHLITLCGGRKEAF